MKGNPQNTGMKLNYETKYVWLILRVDIPIKYYLKMFVDKTAINITHRKP